MGFGDLKSSAGLSALNNFLADRSYIDGYTPSQADVAIFEALSGAPGATLIHALRWYNQTKSYSKQFASLPGIKKPVDQYGDAAAAAPAQNGGGDDDDDFDLFGDDDSDDEAAMKEMKEQKQKNKEEEEKKKKGKKVVIAKSSVVMDIKPWSDETDLVAMEKEVRTITMDGLLWGASKLVPIAYGIKKLQISCVIVDDLVSMDDLEGQITDFEEYVQSIDIAAFNKI